MLCPNCAAPVSDTAKFCPSCGTAVAAAAGSPYAQAQAATSSPYASQAASQQATQAQAAQTQQQTAQTQAQAEPSAFERGYQQGYAWATGESSSQPYQQQSYQYQSGGSYGQPEAPTYAATPSAKNKVAAGLLAIFLGSLGVHKFYLGYSREGIIMLLVTLLGSMVTFGFAGAAMQVIGIIEGVIYLVKSDAEFSYTYEYGHKGWF